MRSSTSSRGMRLFLTLSALSLTVAMWPVDIRAQSCPKDTACEDMTDPPCDVMDQLRCWEGLRNHLYRLCTYRGVKCSPENAQEFHRIQAKLGELGARMETQIQPN